MSGEPGFPRHGVGWILLALSLVVAGSAFAFRYPDSRWSTVPFIAGLSCLAFAVDTGSREHQALRSLHFTHRETRLTAALVCGIPVALSAVGHWTASRVWFPEWASGVAISLGLLAFMPLVPIAGVAALFALAAAWRRDWALLRSAMVIGGVATVASVTFIAAATPLIRMRVSGFSRLGAEASPVIEAIVRYERERGSPPAGFAELVPTHLPSLPPLIRRIEYLRADRTVHDLHGNPWALRMNASFGLGFDSLVYFPRQNYPAFMFGGGPERAGAWVYVHE